MPRSARLLVLAVLAAITIAPLVSACGDPHRHGAHTAKVRLSGPVLAVRMTPPESVPEFRQVGLLLDGSEAPELRFRVRGEDGVWSEARPVEITFSEPPLHVGRILLDAPAVELELDGGAGLETTAVEFYPEVAAIREAPLAREQPYATRTQAIAPRELVIPRAEWGARQPGLICGNVVDPYRMSVHHTAEPADDGGDAAARMRQIQAYHMDSNGWCDIGYHFVVSQAGQIYQARSDERRPGAHVGNQNSGNVGICLIGNFQEQQVGDPQFAAAAAILGWVSRTYGIPLDRSVVKGHREWPGQGTACPGNNLLARFDELLGRAAGGGEPPPPANVDVDFRVGWVGAPPDRIPGEMPELLPGERAEVEIVIHNRSPGPLRGVRAAWLIEEPFLRATSYTIETDHPARDRQTWVINDADGAPENPAKDAMGPTGVMTMYAFGAGEAKRIRIQVEAVGYSVGLIDHPDVRGWVKHIDDIYGEQDVWDGAPGTDRVGRRLQGFVQADVLGRDVWRFDGGQLEGWSACDPATVDQLMHNPADGGLLAMHLLGDDACVVSPEWTSVDAAAWDTLVLRHRAHDGPQPLAVRWAAAGAAFDDERVVRFEAPGDSMFRDLVIPIATHPAWSGAVGRLRLDPAFLAGGNGWHDLDAVFFQSSARRVTSAPGQAFVEAAAVALDLPPDVMPREDAGEMPGPGPGPDADGGPDERDTGAGPGGSDAVVGGDATAEPEGRGSASHSGGCSAAGNTTAAPLAALLLLGLARRRRAAG